MTPANQLAFGYLLAMLTGPLAAPLALAQTSEPQRPVPDVVTPSPQGSQSEQQPFAPKILTVPQREHQPAPAPGSASQIPDRPAPIEQPNARPLAASPAENPPAGSSPAPSPPTVSPPSASTPQASPPVSSPPVAGPPVVNAPPPGPPAAKPSAAAEPAETPPPAPEGTRYTFSRVADGFLRLDTRTGQVSRCSKHSAGWACGAVADERSALENEIARLQTENAALKKEVLAHGGQLPGGITALPPENKHTDSYMKMPSDRDIDRAMAFVDRIWRRLVEMIENFQRDIQPRKG